MAYERKVWSNKGVAGAIPLSAKNLNRMEDGIEEALNRVVISTFSVTGELHQENLGFKPRYLAVCSDNGNYSFSMFQNTKNTRCGLVDEGFVVYGDADITNAKLSEYFTESSSGSKDANDEYYHFKYEEATGKYVSNNNGKNNTKASTKLTAKIDMEIEFVYGCSSESGADKLYVSHIDQNGVLINKIANGISGTSLSEATTRCVMHTGESLVFTYEKDGSMSKGSDAAYFKNLKVIGLVGDWSYMAVR